MSQEKIPSSILSSQSLSSPSQSSIEHGSQGPRRMRPLSHHTILRPGLRLFLSQGSVSILSSLSLGGQANGEASTTRGAASATETTMASLACAVSLYVSLTSVVTEGGLSSVQAAVSTMAMIIILFIRNTSYTRTICFQRRPYPFPYNCIRVEEGICCEPRRRP